MNEPNSCFGRDALQDFFDGRIDDEVRFDAISSHLGDCERCLALLDELATGPTERPEGSFLTEAQYRRALAFAETIPNRLEQELPKKIANFEVLARLGTGAVGEVFYVWDHSVNLPRVVKRLRASRSLDERFHRRIEKEAKRIGLVSDPRVAKPIFAGTDDGYPYIVMEYVDGRSLRERVQSSGPVSHADAAAIGVELAMAIDSVHKAGLIHRDIKPDNVICSADRVTLVDLGLAAERTEATSIAGTPTFMAPEQASELAEVDSRADYYGLAATMYFLLTGEPPLRIQDDSSRESQLDAVKTHPGAELSRVRPDLPSRFTRVVDQYLRVYPDDRPRNLEPWLNECRHYAEATHRGKLLGIFCAVVLLTIGFIVYGWTRGFDNLQREDPEVRRWVADQNWQPGPTRKRALGLAYSRADLGVDWELDTKYPRSSIRHIRLSPDGELLACLAGEGALRIYDLSENPVRLRHLLPNDRISDYYFLTLAWSNDGTRLAVGSNDKRSISVWNVVSAKLECTIDLGVYLNGVAWSPNDTNIISCDESGAIRIWTSNGEPIATIAELDSAVHRLAWHPGGEPRIASISADGLLRIWDTENYEQMHQVKLGNSMPWSVSWNPMDFRIAVVADDGVMSITDERAQLLEQVDIDASVQYDVRWSPDGTKLVFVGRGGCYLWQGNEVSLLCEARIRPQSVVWRNDSNHLMIPDPAKGLLEQNVKSGVGKVILRTTSNSPHAVCWNPAGNRIALATSGGTIWLFDRSGTSQGTFRLSRVGTFSRLAWSPDGRFLVAPVPYGHEITIWDVEKQELSRSLVGSNISNAACWLGDKLITGGEDKKVTVWSTKTWSAVSDFDAGETVEDIAAHPSESVFAFGDRGGDLRFVSLEPDGTCRETGTSVSFDEPIRSIAWNSIGNVIAVADEQKQLCLVDYESRNIQRSQDLWSRNGFVSWQPSGELVGVGQNGIFDGQSLERVWASFELVGFSFGWSPNLVTSGSSYGVIRTFNPGTRGLAWMAVLTSDSEAVTLSPAGEVVAATGNSIDDMVVSARDSSGEYKTLNYVDFYERIRK